VGKTSFTWVFAASAFYCVLLLLLQKPCDKSTTSSSISHESCKKFDCVRLFLISLVEINELA
jgi:hypothetical protein